MNKRDLPLHIKWRPECIKDMVGNDSILSSLEIVLSRAEGEVRSFLFSGPSGTGKTTLARIIKNILKCSDRDFYEYNAADVRGIDTIRDIIFKSRYSPMIGEVKIYLIDEAHRLTVDAQNALLKLLEDTPKHVRIILCTTEPDKIIKTIRTRCTTFNTSALNSFKIIELLSRICEKEGVALSENILQEIAKASEGSPRQALVILDQIIDIPDSKEALRAIQSINIEEKTILELCQGLMRPNIKWGELSKILQGISEDPEKVRYAILTYMSKVLLSKPDDRAANIIQLFSSSWIYSGKASLVLNCYLVTKL